MENRNFVTAIALFLGSLIVSGLLLNIFSLFKPWIVLLLGLALAGLILWHFKDKIILPDRNELVLLIITLAISLGMLVINKFPFSDFWWYHAKNWFIVNYLLDMGKIITWIPFWHFGYPLLQMYGPGSHIIAVLATKILGIPVFYGGIITNIIAYVLLILTFYAFVSKHLEKKLALFSAVIVAISPRLFNEVFIQGHYPNLLALAFGLLGLSFFNEEDKKSRMLFAIFMFLSLITHFSFFTILLFAAAISLILLRKFKDYKKLARFIIPIMLAGFMAESSKTFNLNSRSLSRRA